ncbi:MAG: hypothetical protein ACM3NQ_12065 [Bacteroidales bacterium]
MSVTDLGVKVPPAAAAWIDWVMLIFLGLFILWAVLKAIGFALRRSYNLTPVATASTKDIRLDFLTLDRAAQKQMVERGREFDRATTPGVVRAARVTNWGVVVSGIVTLVSAAFLALGRIEEFDTTWQKLSAQDKFVAIVQSHPVGFAIAAAMIAAALYRLMKTVRTTT